MKKRILIIFIFCIYFLNSNNIFANIGDLDVNARYVGVYSVDNLIPIYEKNSQDKIPIASITKIMTAIVCMDNIDDLNKKVIVDLPQVEKYYDEDYSTAGLKDKQEISYYDLIATMLIPSGADSAACIALNVFEDYSKFINAMNDKAKELGMNNTSFANPIGADDVNNYSTIQDVALMMKYALSNKTIKNLMSTYEYTTKDGTITVHNALFQLADIYDINVNSISGGKTGMTEDAGYCLASYSDKEAEPIICIVMGCKIEKGTLYHLSDSEKIYEDIKKNYSLKSIVNQGEEITILPISSSIQKQISIGAAEDVKIYMLNNEEIEKEKITIEYTGLDMLSSTNKKGDIVGKVGVYYDGTHIKDIDVVVNEKVILSIVDWSKDNKRFTMFILTMLALLIVAIYIIIKIRK
ncbi:MAG: D-alanyl-D-alanine carboxypeptidase family protein [Clostridia bacterium]